MKRPIPSPTATALCRACTPNPGSGSTKPRLWDPATGKALAALEGHTAATTAVRWSPDSKSLVTAGHDKTGLFALHPASITVPNGGRFSNAAVRAFYRPKKLDGTIIRFKPGAVSFRITSGIGANRCDDRTMTSTG